MFVMIAEHIYWHERIWIFVLHILDQVVKIVGGEFEIDHSKIKYHGQPVICFASQKLADDSRAAVHFANGKFLAELITYTSKLSCKLKILPLVHRIFHFLEEAC